MSAATREAALRGWWDGLTIHARDNAHTAALEGAYLPDGLLHELIAAGVIVLAGGFVPHHPPTGSRCPVTCAPSSSPSPSRQTSASHRRRPTAPWPAASAEQGGRAAGTQFQR